MSRTARPAAFILTASDHGTMIVNRFDYGMVNGNAAFGVGFQVLQTGGYDQPEVASGLRPQSGFQTLQRGFARENGTVVTST
jgi:hypothetical protein